MGDATALQNRQQTTYLAKPQDGNAEAANTAKTGSRRSATADHKSKIALLERQLSESLEQQAATSEVLQIISSPQTSITAVLDAVAANAVRLCEALNATILSSRWRRCGDSRAILTTQRRPDWYSASAQQRLGRRACCSRSADNSCPRLVYQ